MFFRAKAVFWVALPKWVNPPRALLASEGIAQVGGEGGIRGLLPLRQSYGKGRSLRIGLCPDAPVHALHGAARQRKA